MARALLKGAVPVIRTLIVTALLGTTAAVEPEQPAPEAQAVPDQKKKTGSDAFTLVFVGGSAGEGTTPTLRRLEARLAELDPKTTVVVFTGHYAQGELPPKEAPDREAAEAAVKAHVQATSAFVERGGRVYYLPGDSDFGAGGAKAVKRLRKFLNAAYRKADDDAADVMPLKACGDPFEVKLSDEVVLLLLNSQWWMEDWANDPDANDGCDLKSRVDFQLHVQNTFSPYRTRRVIVASHHPLASYGEHGGAFTARAHADPAPVIGTVRVLALQSGLVPQYENHPMFRSYRDTVRGEAQRYGTFVFASGHDASLQSVRVEQQTQLIAGTSATHAAPVTSTAPGDFAAASPGWLEVTVAQGGRTLARFFADDGQTLFEEAVPDLAPFAEKLSDPPPMPSEPVPFGYDKRAVWKPGGFLKFFIGSYYSDAYSLRLPYAPLDLEAEGLEPYKTGGGLQTNSLRLRDSNGGDWAMRATTKDSSRVIPYPYNRVPALRRLMDHGSMATHPEAALSVPVLASAIGVLHPEPKLMYLPDQAALGKFRGFVGNEVVMLEQRPSTLKEGTLPDSLVGEGATKFKGTDELLEKLADAPEKNRVDQEAMLRARLLDLLIGDWDRHQDQWTFAGVPADDGSMAWRPIPRDRDQAFANYDGFGLAVMRLMVPVVRNLQPYRGEFPGIAWSVFGARGIDPLLLNQIPHERWRQIAEEVKAQMTDQVIADAFATWHPEAYALDGQRLEAYTRQRRDHWLEAAEAFYRHLALDVDVLGSNGADVFDLTFFDDGRARLTATTKGEVFYQRTFLPTETRELRIYALEGDDALSVHGTPTDAITVRFIGGEGKDQVSAGDGPRAKPLNATAVRVYDDVKGATLDPSLKLTDERSSLSAENQFDRLTGHDPDSLAFFPGLAVNPDDGLFLGGDFTWIVNGFKKQPFAARHVLAARFATATLGATADYHGFFPRSVGLLDQRLDVALKSPTYTRNFFGLTNHFDDEAAAPDYYRVRQAEATARYGLAYGFDGERSAIGGQLTMQMLMTEATPGRFVTVSPDVTPNTFGPRSFGGGKLFAWTNTYDNLGFPRRGVALGASVESHTDLQRAKITSATLRGSAGIALPFDRAERFVLLSRATLEGIAGDHPFYFSPTLGSDELRAYPRQAFAGDVAFAHSSDLRVDVFRFHSTLPSVVGFNLSADHGRVFGRGASDDYHLSLGGGVFWFLLDTVGVSVNAHASLDGAFRVQALVGPLFGNPLF